MSESLPIVFLGPSLEREKASSILQAEYRPPVRRGDLEQIEGPTTVAIIDGVFEQSRSVSPRELIAAAGRGVRIVGCSSMGALRAAEVPKAMVGYGKVFSMYRDGTLADHD